MGNTGYGIVLQSSSNNTIENNTISNNNGYAGIILNFYSSGNKIMNNTISGNKGQAIAFRSSSNNLIYLNKFMGNEQNVGLDLTSLNIWNSTQQMSYDYGEESYTNYRGNYWDDYTGSDADGDGIGDTPYVINSQNQDNYPVVNLDLMIESLNITPQEVLLGYPVTVNVTIKNTGNANAQNFNVSFYANDTEIEIETVSSLNASESIDLSINWTPYSPGVYSIRVIVDSDGNIAESNENNNEASGTAEILSPPDVIYVPDLYSSIQAAVQGSSSGGTVIVRDGVYFENVVIEKQLTLKSENGSTVIDGNGIGNTITLNSDGIWLEGFEIRNSTTRVMVNSDNNTIIRNNIMGSDSGRNIFLNFSDNNTITENTITGGGTGIFIEGGTKNTISRNNISYCYLGNIYIEDGSNNVFTQNNISDGYYGVILSGEGNIFYLNDFVNNFFHVGLDFSNIWNSTEQLTYRYNDQQFANYLGNYWDDYTGSDSDGDGIGDTSYVILDPYDPYSVLGDTDFHPLVHPFENYLLGVSENQNPVAIITEPHEGVAGLVGEQIAFSASDSYDPDGSIVNYSWEFGDGSTASGIIVQHSYSSPGVYSVNLTVTDDGGATNTSSIEISVIEISVTTYVYNSTKVPAHPVNYYFFYNDSDTITVELNLDISPSGALPVEKINTTADFSLIVDKDPMTEVVQNNSGVNLSSTYVFTMSYSIAGKPVNTSPEGVFIPVLLSFNTTERIIPVVIEVDELHAPFAMLNKELKADFPSINNPNTTEMKSIDDFSNVSYLSFEFSYADEIVGRIELFGNPEPINLLDRELLSNISHLDQKLIMTNNWTVIKNAGDGMRELNRSSRVSLYNISDGNFSIYLTDDRGNPIIEIYNSTSGESNPSYLGGTPEYVGGTLRFEVTHWSGYLVQQHPQSSAESTYNISGRIFYDGDKNGEIFILAYDHIPHEGEAPQFWKTISRPGEFTLLLPNGSYYILAFMDINGNGDYTSGEPLGFALNRTSFEEADVITVNGEDLQDVNITLTSFKIIVIAGSSSGDNEVAIPVFIENVTDITAMNFTIHFNPESLQVLSVDRGWNNTDNLAGAVRIALVFDPALTALEPTPVVNITFSVTGSSYLNLTDVELSSENFAPFSPDIIVNGSITVRGDFNGGGVDIADVSYVAYTVIGKVPPNLSADFNNNGRVDIGDLAKMAYYLLGKIEAL